MIDSLDKQTWEIGSEKRLGKLHHRTAGRNVNHVYTDVQLPIKWFKKSNVYNKFRHINDCQS